MVSDAKKQLSTMRPQAQTVRSNQEIPFSIFGYDGISLDNVSKSITKEVIEKSQSEIKNELSSSENKRSKYELHEDIVKSVNAYIKRTVSEAFSKAQEPKNDDPFYSNFKEKKGNFVARAGEKYAEMKRVLESQTKSKIPPIDEGLNIVDMVTEAMNHHIPSLTHKEGDSLLDEIHQEPSQNKTDNDEKSRIEKSATNLLKPQSPVKQRAPYVRFTQKIISPREQAHNQIITEQEAKKHNSPSNNKAEIRGPEKEIPDEIPNEYDYHLSRNIVKPSSKEEQHSAKDQEASHNHLTAKSGYPESEQGIAEMSADNQDMSDEGYDPEDNEFLPEDQITAVIEDLQKAGIQSEEITQLGNNLLGHSENPDLEELPRRGKTPVDLEGDLGYFSDDEESQDLLATKGIDNPQVSIKPIK